MQLERSVLGLLGAASLAAAVPAVHVQGNYFANNATGDRYQIVGVAYQPGGSSGYYEGVADPLSNKESCLRDAAIMQMLGVNAIRVYNVDPNLNHDDCAAVFEAAGMYMFIDVNTPLPGQSIDSSAPWSSYNVNYLNHTFAVVEAFKNYPNLAAFFSGNEVISDIEQGSTVPKYIRAVTRDLKKYIANHVDRPIPVGYSAADVRPILFDSWAYMQCTDTDDGTPNDASRVDFFSLNSYSWCGNSSFTTSGYDQLVAGFQNSSVPIFFSEYGCNNPEPRIFNEVHELYSAQMSGIFSGGMVYEFTYGTNDYGIVNISSGNSAQLLEDFYTLRDQFKALDWNAIQGSAIPSKSPIAPKCSASLISTSNKFTTDFALPEAPTGVQALIDAGLRPAPSGKLVTIEDYSVTYTVKDKNGNVIPDLKVKPLAADQINQPGINSQAATGTGKPSTSPSATGATGTSSASPSASSIKGAATGIRSTQTGLIPLSVVSAVITGFVVSFLGCMI